MKIFFHENQPKTVIITISDISKQKELEREEARLVANLRESEERFRLLFENMNEAFLLGEIINDSAGHPKDYRILDLNPAYERNLGLKRARLIGHTVCEAFKNPNPIGIEQFGKVALEGKPLHFELSSNIVNRIFSVYAFPMSNLRFGALLLDITARKHTEDSLRRQAQLIDLTPDAFIVRKDDGTINFWSRGSEKLYGWSSKEAIGKQTHDLFKTIFPEPFEKIRNKLIKDSSWSGELIHTTKDGRQITVLSHWISQLTKNGAIGEIFESNIDITKRKNFELELEHRKDETEAANKELESFSYAVSHDLRAPLRAVSGFSQALLEDYSECVDSQGQDYLRRVRDGAKRMDDLIEAILRLSRQTRKPLNCENIDFSQMAESIIQQLRIEFPQRKVEVRIGHCQAFCDRELCKTALENLIRNAWKFTKKKAEAFIEVNCFIKNGEQVYFVKDNGAGFDMRYADKLFVPFQRLHDVREFPGIGVGLSTVKHIVQKHGGRIWAEGEPEKGATFYFTLPEM